jgi:hypothetical protein
VTAENKGRFTDTWDGLDDNFMPAPPGTYGVKGIFLPAETWPVDGKPHTLTAKLAGGPFAFLPRPDQDTQPPKVHGDPVNSPPGDVGTFGESAVFTWIYLENGTNNFVLDLAKPVGLDQIVGARTSGGPSSIRHRANGGLIARCTARAWCCSTASRAGWRRRARATSRSSMLPRPRRWR